MDHSKSSPSESASVEGTPGLGDSPVTVDFRDQLAVYLRGVKRPTFLYDKELFVRLKFEEYEDICRFLDSWKEIYQGAGLPKEAEHLAIVEVEPNQELVDDLFQSTGKFELFVRGLPSPGQPSQ